MDANVTWCETLYAAKAAQLILYGRAMGLSHSEAEDILQDTFISLLRLPTPPEKPEHYCLRAYRNRALNYKRGIWRRIIRELESRQWFERSESAPAEEKRAVQCLAQLPREQREVIVLKIWHQHTFEEIAELLDASPNTIAGRYRYGMQKIRNSLTRPRSHSAYEPIRRDRTSFELFDSPPPLLGD